jgi:mono/diheme cytochrome c family protein
MKWIILSCATTAITLATQFPVLAQPIESNGIPSGHQVAITICGSCHEIGMSEKHSVAPGFGEIANLPSTTALSLKVFLHSNHSNMPNLIISNTDTDDVIAYILSLKKK